MPVVIHARRQTAERGMKRIGMILAVMMVACGGSARADEISSDRHSGYYYPVPESSETYTARVNKLVDSDRTRRIAFVTGVTSDLAGRNYPPTYAIFAKGDDAEKLIIVGLMDGQLDTIYRARALFATLTAVARLTPVFQELPDADRLTFFDLLKLLGFRQVTVTDGVGFAHQVFIE
jgi:hypothetical protein